MNTVINKLLDVDKEARQALDDAQQYYERTLLEIEEEKKKMLASYMERGREHIHELEAEQAGEVAEVVAEARRRATALLSALDALYEENHQQWEDELFRRTISDRN